MKTTEFKLTFSMHHPIHRRILLFTLASLSFVVLTGNLFSQEDLAERMENAIKLMKSSGQAPPSAIAPMLASAAEGYILKGDFETALARVKESLALSREHDLDPTSAFFTVAKILNKADDEVATEFLLGELKAPGASNKYKKGVLKALEMHTAINGNVKLGVQANYEAWQIAKAEKPGSIEEVQALHNFGSKCLEAKLYDLAGPALKDARAMALKIGSPELAANSVRSLGYALSGEGNYTGALDLFKQSVEFSRSSGDATLLGFELQNVATTQIQLNQFDAAEKSLAEAKTLARVDFERGHLDSMSSALALKKAITEGGGKTDFSAALALQKSAVEAKLLNNVVGEEFALLGAIPDFVILASYQILGGDLEGARASLAQATRGADAWEANARNAQKAAVFSADQVNLSMSLLRSRIYDFQQQVDVISGDTTAALVTAENGRGAAQAELLRAKLGMPTSDLVVKTFDADVIKEIARSQNTTLVVYSIAHTLPNDLRRYLTPSDRLYHPQKLYVWTVSPEGKITFRQVPLTGPLGELVSAARKEITEPPAQPLAKSPRAVLSKLLIDPVLEELPKEEGSLVTFIPQGPLFLVPFAALPLGDGMELIDQYTIGMSPSIELLDLAKEQKEAVIQADLKEVLLVGNPTMPGYQSRPDREAHTLSPLPGAEAEAKYLGGILKTEPLIGDAATEVAVAARMENARFLHFATHGLLESESSYNESFLSALAFAAGEGEDGFLTVRETARMNLHAELAVLSACDTGRGQISGDGVIGLSRGYITAGVPTVVVSLWPVSDEATAVLMGHFYEAMTSGAPKAQALRSAILTTKKKYPAPGMWAPFVLYGLAG